MHFTLTIYLVPKRSCWVQMSNAGSLFVEDPAWPTDSCARLLRLLDLTPVDESRRLMISTSPATFIVNYFQTGQTLQGTMFFTNGKQQSMVTLTLCVTNVRSTKCNKVTQHSSNIMRLICQAAVLKCHATDNF